MKISLSLLLVASLTLFLFSFHGPAASKSQEVKASAESRRPELAYYQAVNKIAPPEDPQLLFLLMSQYSNSNQQAEGVEFLSARLDEFGPKLTAQQKALYLSAIGLLRAQQAARLPLLRRFGYVKETIATLDQAKQLSGGKIFVVNWISGVVRAQLPGVFRQKKAAQDDLTWCLENSAKAPHAGWMREVYYHLGQLADDQGEKGQAQDFLRRSGYTTFAKPITLLTPFSERTETGHTFAPRRITEIVAGKVYLLSGFEFTEYYFVVSDDRRQLIGIDAGTRPDSAKEAYDALRAYAPHLPELTTVLITHAHWDHIGGHKYFRSLSPRVRFYGRRNYQEELDRELHAPGIFAKQFFGQRFNFEDLEGYKPDVAVDRQTDLRIGGTRFALIPVEGGETRDAMFIHLPDQGIMFVGDFIMPYIGAPFVEEGDLRGLLEAIDLLVARNPEHLLHGHEPLTRNFASPAMLAQLKLDLAWLRDQVLEAVRRGDERSAVHQANLIPPGLLQGSPDVFQPYIILREHVIDRLFDQNVGYWNPADLSGLDHLGVADRAELLVDYLGVSDKQVASAVERMAADGKYELASSLLESSGDRFAHSEAVARARRLVYLKLMEKNQNTDPFKYIIYSAKIAEQTPPITPGN